MLSNSCRMKIENEYFSGLKYIPFKSPWERHSYFSQSNFSFTSICFDLGFHSGNKSSTHCSHLQITSNTLNKHEAVLSKSCRIENDSFSQSHSPSVSNSSSILQNYSSKENIFNQNKTSGENMKWVKHYVNAQHSDSISELIERTGLLGYGRYWALLELLGDRFDGTNYKFRIPKKLLRETFRIRSWTELDSFADHLSTVSGMVVKRSENVFEIEAPILLDLLGRDFRVARQSRADSAPKNKIKNKDIDKDNNIDQNEFDRATVVKFNFDILYDKYPRKVGKSKGLKACKVQIKTQGDYDALSLSIDRYKAYCEANIKDPQFIKHFSTFMSSWRDWLDADTGSAVAGSTQEDDLQKWIREKKAEQGEAS